MVNSFVTECGVFVGDTPAVAYVVTLLILIVRQCWRHAGALVYANSNTIFVQYIIIALLAMLC